MAGANLRNLQRVNGPTPQCKLFGSGPACQDHTGSLDLCEQTSKASSPLHEERAGEEAGVQMNKNPGGGGHHALDRFLDLKTSLMRRND